MNKFEQMIEQGKVLNVAIVGGGSGCMAIMDMIFAKKLRQLRMKLIGVADTNPKAMGYRYALEKGIYTTKDYRDLYALKDLNMIIEVTDRDEVANEIFRTKPDHVQVMGHVAARVFWDVFQIEEERIAERRCSEEAIRKSEERYRRITEAVTDYIFTVRIEDGRPVETVHGPACVAVTGYSPEEFADPSLWIMMVPEEDRAAVQEQARSVLLGQDVLSIKHRILRKDGVMCWVKNTIVPHYDRQGSLLSYDGLISDINKRKEAEEAKAKLELQLRHAQKMEAVGTLAGGVAHDFNNILQAISGYAQLLLMEKGVNDTERLYLNQIDKSTRKAAELTKQLLIFGRKVESELRPVDLNQEVKGVYMLLQRTIPKMIDIELDLAEDLKFINADILQLERITMNLGVNAMDVMPDGGKLTFETKNVFLDEAYCKTHVYVIPGEYVLLRVSDTGHGMDRETLEHIFEPFYTTKETGKGTGLGLAIVFGLVKSHGGHILCYSEPGQGAIFNIHFPALAIGETEQEQELEEEAVIRGGHETVLIVDDEEDLRDQGRDILNKYGYTVITAESGEKAIEIYKREKDRIDLVILDIGMPGMGGYKCLEQLFKIDPEIKIIIASGYASSGMVDEALKSGAADFIGKPYSLTDILKRVRELLGQVY